MRVLVTGGSGFVGQALISALLAAGHDVRALARRPAAAVAVTAAGAVAIDGDLAPASGLHAALAGCDAVIHAAGIVRLWGHDAEMRALHVDGTAALLAAARRAGVTRFVQIGAASVLCDGRVLALADDSTPLPRQPLGAYSQTKAAAERLVRAANAPGFTTIVVRPPWIWGPGNPVLPRLIAMARSRSWRWIDHGTYPGSTCHVANVAEGATLALRHGQGGEAYFITDTGTRTQRQFLTDMLASQGVDLGNRSISRGMAKLIARLSEAAWTLLPLNGEPPLTRAMVAMTGTPLPISDARARRDLGYTAHIAYADGMAALAANRAPAPP